MQNTTCHMSMSLDGFVAGPEQSREHAFAFGLLCLLIAVHDFALVTIVGALRPLTIAVSGAYFALALRFWFYVPALVTGGACACFTIAALTA